MANAWLPHFAAWALLLTAPAGLLLAWRAPERRPWRVAAGWLLVLLAVVAWCRAQGWEVGLPTALMWLSPLAWLLVLTQAERRPVKLAPARHAGAEPGPAVPHRLWQFLGAGPLGFAVAVGLFTSMFFHLPLALPVDRAIVGALVVLVLWPVVVTWVMLTRRPRRACAWLSLWAVCSVGVALLLVPARPLTST